MSEMHVGKMLIGGEWTFGNPLHGMKILNITNPATEEVMGTIPHGGAQDCAQAISAAADAGQRWAATPAFERAAILEKAAALMRSRNSELAALATAESGKTLRESAGEWTVAANFFSWYASECQRLGSSIIPARNPARSLQVMHCPLGVVGVITAWNFPAYNPARSWAPALAAGCTVVAKPAELTPFSALQMAAILTEAGLPPGVLNLVMGDAVAIGEEMMSDPRCRKLSFTGSLAVGKKLMVAAAATCTRLSLELGGNGPVIITGDVDVEAVARGAVTAKFRNSGQVCIAPQRFYVHSSIYDSFLGACKRFAESLRQGNGAQEDSEVGPLISAQQRQRVENFVQSAIAAGAEVVCGGKRPSHLGQGYFYAPTVLAVAHGGAGVWQQEVFGPVMTVSPWEQIEQAVQWANDSEFGLAAFVFAGDAGTAAQVAMKLEAGLVGVNDWYPQSIEAPFVGWKQSGIGKECGREGLMEYLQEKVIATAIPAKS